MIRFATLQINVGDTKRIDEFKKKIEEAGFKIAATENSEIFLILDGD